MNKQSIFGFGSAAKVGPMNAVGHNASAAKSSLKTKLGSLEDMIHQVKEEINNAKIEV